MRQSRLLFPALAVLLILAEQLPLLTTFTLRLREGHGNEESSMQALSDHARGLSRMQSLNLPGEPYII